MSDRYQDIPDIRDGDFYKTLVTLKWATVSKE